MDDPPTRISTSLPPTDRPIPENARPPLTSHPSFLPVPTEDLDFDTYTDLELVRLHEELTRKTRLLTLENSLFESFLRRVDPHSPALAPDTQTRTDQPPTTQPDSTDQQTSTRKKKKLLTQKEAYTLISLTPDQKSEIATREVEELRDEIEKKREEWGKVLDNYKAEMEEVEIRMDEIKKAGYEFRRDIVGSAINLRTGKIIAERVLRYFEDKIRAKDAIIEKIRLKNATLKVQKNKLHLQLKQKEEMGEVLHAIDFDQLQIENKQYLAKIEERNAELLKLKMTAGNTVQILNYYKKKLQTLSTQSQTLRTEIAQRRDQLTKLTVESDVVSGEQVKAQQLHDKLVSQMEEYRVPLVMDYVGVKAQEHELARKVRSWERKVEIAVMQAQR
ncbi:hypothetical protein HDV00_005909 [Rhizophlyctis rosea]|nr:hypothetical protein HDV00_005909 [Rhizophlyctis rosea]